MAQNLGEFEQLILLALMRLSDDAYGMSVRTEISSRTGRDVSISAVYTTLERLETKGHAESYVGEPTARRGGRRKKHYRMTAAGVTALERSYQALHEMASGLGLESIS
ncbi:MAG: PadR family transcriptional regulator [Acidobacteria bacterium]|nr:PadR family transcriptional regulator [Acidobacteriota bacterium]